MKNCQNLNPTCNGFYLNCKLNYSFYIYKRETPNQELISRNQAFMMWTQQTYTAFVFVLFFLWSVAVSCNCYPVNKTNLSVLLQSLSTIS